MFKLAKDTIFQKRKHDAQYLDYMLRHKINMAQAGIKLNLPVSTIIKHDWSKFKPEIWAPHRDYFYGSTGISGTNEREPYLVYKDSRKLHFLLEPGHHGLNKDLNAELESVADWYAVGKANASLAGQTYPSFKAWWVLGRQKFSYQLSPAAVEKVNQLVALDINLIDYLTNHLKV